MMRLHSAKSIHSFIAAQHKSNRETWGWYHLTHTTQRVILEASMSNSLTIQYTPALSIQRFLNGCNAIAIQEDFDLTYAGHKLYLPISLFQSLLQGHTLEIPNPNSPTGLSSLLTSP